MSRRAAAWLAWSMWTLCVALFAFTMVSLLQSPPITTSDTPEAPEPLIVLFRVMALTFPTVGAFVASRRPGNPTAVMLMRAPAFFSRATYSVLAYCTP